MCAELLFAEKWPPTKAIGGNFCSQKAAITRKRTNVSSACTPPVLPGQHILWVCNLPTHANCTDPLQTHLTKTFTYFLEIKITTSFKLAVWSQFKFIMPDHDRCSRNDRMCPLSSWCTCYRPQCLTKLNGICILSNRLHRLSNLYLLF